MRKVIGMFAVLLALAGCNKAETDFQPEETAEGITITATLAAKTAPTKAVADNGDNKITSTWAQDEKIAILYERPMWTLWTARAALPPSVLLL